MISSPCKKDCPDRQLDCHFEGHCKKYTEYKKQIEEFKSSKEYRKYVGEHLLGLSNKLREV